MGSVTQLLRGTVPVTLRVADGPDRMTGLGVLQLRAVPDSGSCCFILQLLISQFSPLLDNPLGEGNALSLLTLPLSVKCLSLQCSSRTS